MADVKLLQYDGTEKQYLGVERVQLATVDGGTAIFSEGEAVEGIEIAPDFSAGDMTVDAPAGTLVKSAVIKQPETLVPENIRRGVSVAGIEGELIGDTEELAVELDMSEGNQIIVPTQEGKVISQVTVTKPETLVPENILAGVDIGGVVGELDQPDPVETEIDLDFSAGAMEVVPLDGKVFSKVSIPVPEGLAPENIAEGITVAGIIGTLASGGNNIVYDSGSISGITQATSDVVVNHNLGVVPDIVIISTSYAGGTTSSYIKNYCGVSSTFANAIGKIFGSFATTVSSSITSGGSNYFRVSFYNTVADSSFIDTTAIAFVSFVNNANENSFTLKNGGGSVWFTQSATYTWIAIGGLT